MSGVWRLLGGPGSPYSLKLRAAFRHRRVPHLWMTPTGYLGSGGELAEAGKGMIPVLQAPEGGYLADSTPILRTFERRFAGDGRSLAPPDPAAAFLAGLIEDFADEWLVYAMFDNRWSTDEEANFCARRQLSAWLGPMPAAAFDERVAAFSARQRRARGVICGDETNRPVWRETCARIEALVERMLEARMFLFGARPSFGDFGLFGPLSQLAVDPTESAAMKARAPRCFQWVQSLDDLSGVEGEWAEDWPAILPDLLRLIGETHLAYSAALADLVEAGAPGTLRLRPFGMDFALEFEPRRDLKPKGLGPIYRLRSLGALKGEMAALPAEARARLDPLLQATGCWEALQPRPGEDLSPLLPR